MGQLLFNNTNNWVLLCTSVDAVVKQRKRPIPSSCFLSQPNTGNGRVPRVVVKILSSNVIVNYVRSLDLIMYEINCYKIKKKKKKKNETKAADVSATKPEQKPLSSKKRDSA